MKVENLVKIIGSDFYTGVPDSQLKALCNYLMAEYGIDPKHHMIAANETVGGMPTVAALIDMVGIAKACGYPNAVSVDTFEDLDIELEAAKNRNELSFIEVKCSIGARDDLGRPTTTALENKENFMEYVSTLS